MKVFWNWRSLCAALLLLSGCAGTGDVNGPMTEARAADLIEAVLTDIEEIYYRETKTSDLVAAGLEHVGKTYSGVTFVREGNAFSAKVGNESVSSFRAGQDKGDSNDWADNVAATLVNIRQTLPEEDPANLGSLTDTFLEGIVGSLDGRTRYFAPSYARHLRNQRDGREGSLNIGLEKSDFGWQINSVNSVDLRESGVLRKGDLITHIDGVPTDGLSKSEVYERISGPVSSAVELTVLRSPHSAPQKVALQRSSRGAQTVGAFPEGGSLRIVVTGLDIRTVDDLTMILASKAPDLGARNGIILDLRETPGGLLESTISLADVFQDERRIVSTEGRHLDSYQYFYGKTAPKTRLPLVVLVSGSTAAGAEIVAAALQDIARAIVVGQRTYGLGTIQTALPLPNTGEFIVTWAEVITPANYHLDKRGVMPTVCTGGDVTAEAVLAELRNGAGTIDYATRSRDIDPEDTAAVDAFRALCPPRSDGADIDLEVARAILEDPALYAEILARDRQSKQAAAQ